MSSIVRVLSADTKSDFLTVDPEDPSKISGVCWDLWTRVAKDLDLQFNFSVVDWYPMVSGFKNNQADVLVQRIDHSSMKEENASE